MSQPVVSKIGTIILKKLTEPLKTGIEENLFCLKRSKLKLLSVRENLMLNQRSWKCKDRNIEQESRKDN